MAHHPAVRRPPAARRACHEWLRLAAFWACFLGETIGYRRLAPLVRRRLGRHVHPHVQGAAHIPPEGVFTLAANHYGERRALDTIAAILAAASTGRPDLANLYLLIVGNRAPKRAGGPPVVRLSRQVLRLVFRRWALHTLRIPLGNEHASVAFLRIWRRRARRQPCLVFPEGRARADLRAIRPGAGRWLAALGVPVLPVAVWYREGVWQVRFGPPLQWSHRPDLRDAQLGLAIAALLPPELAPAWQPGLARWRAAHVQAHTTR